MIVVDLAQPKEQLAKALYYSDWPDAKPEAFDNHLRGGAGGGPDYPSRRYLKLADVALEQCGVEAQARRIAELEAAITGLNTELDIFWNHSRPESQIVRIEYAQQECLRALQSAPSDKGL